MEVQVELVVWLLFKYNCSFRSEFIFYVPVRRYATAVILLDLFARLRCNSRGVG
jgi:hypothetical protein